MLAPLAEEKEESIDEGHEGEEQEEADVLHQAMLLAGWPGLRQAVPRVSNLSHPAAGRAARLGHRGARVRQVTSPPHVSGCHYFASQLPLPFSNSFFFVTIGNACLPSRCHTAARGLFVARDADTRHSDDGHSSWRRSPNTSARRHELLSRARPCGRPPP